MPIEPELLPIGLLALGCMVVLGLFIRRTPRLGIVLWLVTIAFVPVWLGVTVKFYLMPAVALGLVVVAFVVHRRPIKLGLADLLVGAFFLSCVTPLITGGATVTTVFVVLTSWLVPFLLGRLATRSVGLRWTYDATAIVFGVVALVLLIEFVTNWNFFTTVLARGNGLYTAWGTIQERGGVSRAEGAFGHSIAAGSAVAMAMPLALGSRFPAWLRISLVLIMGAGVVVTLSRVSMLGAILGVLFCLFLLRGMALQSRLGLILAGGVVAEGLLPFVVKTLQASDEAAGSASYRAWLLDLVPQISILGFSPAGTRGSDGKLYFGGFQSIDSQLIFTGLLYGWFALIIGIVGLLVAVVTVFSRRASPATISVVAQIPALATVALITQYSEFFWFMVGLAVCSQVEQRHELASDQADGSTDSEDVLGDSDRALGDSSSRVL
jgi:hypothetical protein